MIVCFDDIRLSLLLDLTVLLSLHQGKALLSNPLSLDWLISLLGFVLLLNSGWHINALLLVVLVEGQSRFFRFLRGFLNNLFSAIFLNLRQNFILVHLVSHIADVAGSSTLLSCLRWLVVGTLSVMESMVLDALLWSLVSVVLSLSVVLFSVNSGDVDVDWSDNFRFVVFLTGLSCWFLYGESKSYLFWS